MKTLQTGTLLRIFIGSSDKYQGLPLYEAIVVKARELKLAGATVLRGVMGYGKNSWIHTAGLLTLSTDLPVVIELIDSDEKIHAFLPAVDEMVTEGLVTIEQVTVIKYGPSSPSPGA